MRILIERGLCRDCQACVLGCSLYHDAVCSPARARIVVTKDMARYEFDLRVCHHCTDPDCLAACPVGAMSLDDRGVVVVDDEVCVQCNACADACPFDAIFFHEATGRYLKCDLCAGRREGPLCVQLCPSGALSLGEELS
jgi:Fe-S-cluster-containing dehydrogenase component